MTITMYDEFCGVGGFSMSGQLVPDVEVTDAANHDPEAIEQHRNNFPNARHYQEDVTKLDMEKMPPVDCFAGSPACPPWTDANGVKRDFDQVNAQLKFDLPAIPSNQPMDPKLLKRLAQYRRARLLMEEIPRYLRACIEKGKPVKIGVVENVVQCRLWSEWDRWIGEFRKMGYHVRLIAYNTMHARPVRAPWAGQSRNRLFLAYWHKSLGRSPNWAKWLRPRAYCPTCDTVVMAVQAWKKPDQDMGVYGRNGQYVYRCPQKSCRGQEVFPETVPALTAIDPTVPGIRIGDREAHGLDPLVEATSARILAGMQKWWRPLMVPVGGTWRGGKNGEGAVPLDLPAPTRTTRETDGVASLTPLLLPVEKRAEVNRVTTVLHTARTQTTRQETAVVSATPFIVPLRGGGSHHLSHRVDAGPTYTVTASGNHHGMVSASPTPFLMRHNGSPGTGVEHTSPADRPGHTLTTKGHQSIVSATPTAGTWETQLLVPYYGSAESAIPAAGPAGTLTTRDRYGVATSPVDLLDEMPDLEDVYFRMLTAEEIGRLMGFPVYFRNEAKSKKARVRLYGNAVTPPVGELILSALVECMTGEDLAREVEDYLRFEAEAQQLLAQPTMAADGWSDLLGQGGAR